MNASAVVIAVLAPMGAMAAAAILRLIAAAQPESSSSGHYRTNLITAAATAVGIGFLSLIFTALINGPTAVLLFMVFAIALVQVVSIESDIAGKRLRSRRAELLWMLATTVKNGGSLADNLETYAESAWGTRRRQLLELAERIREGTPMTEIAVPQGILSNSAAVEIQAGLISGRLYEALRSAALRETRELISAASPAKSQMVMLYPMAILMSVVLIVAFVMYYIPKFRKIFEDFGVQLPLITRVMIQVCNEITAFWFLAFPIGWLMVFIVFLFERGEYLGWRSVWQYLLGRWSARVYTAELLRTLSHAVAVNQSLVMTLEGIVSSAAPDPMKRRISAVRDGIESGTSCWDELRKQGFLNRSEVVLLNAAQEAGNLPWTLVAIADALERRWSYRMSALSDCFGPALILVIGGVVGLIAISLFIPVVKLINDLS